MKQEFYIINIQHAYDEPIPPYWIEELKSWGLSVNARLVPNSTDIEAIRVFMYTIDNLNTTLNVVEDLWLSTPETDRWITKDMDDFNDPDDNEINIWLDGFN